MTYEERLRKFEAEVEKLKPQLHPAINAIQFNDGSDHDYQVFVGFYDMKPEHKLADITRNVKKLLNTIPGVRVYLHVSPRMEYFRDHWGKKIRDDYESKSITINLYYYPDEE